MSTVIVGGNRYHKHSSVDYLIQKITKLGPKKLSSAFDELPKDSIGDSDLVKWLVKEINLPNMCIHLMGVLYDEIAKQYCDVLDEWISKNPDAAKTITETKEPRPANYTPAVARISNISFKDLKIEVKGFCVKEPLVRLSNLLKWPIGKFAKITIDDIKVPTPPSAPSSTNGDLYTRIIALVPKLKEWEDYYFQICHSVEQLVNKLKNKSTTLTYN